MTLAEEGERGVIEALVCRDDPESDVFHQSARDPSRGVLADAVGVDEHGEHEGGVIGDATATVLAVFAIERREIELGHHVENEEGEVIVRQSISNRERQQEELVPVHLAQIDRQAPSFRAPRNASRTVRIHATATSDAISWLSDTPDTWPGFWTRSYLRSRSPSPRRWTY